MAAGHVPIETLLAWWLHETDAAETDVVDEHLLRCDACGETLDALLALADGVRAAFKAGLVGAIASAEFVAKVATRGHRVREYRLPWNGGVDAVLEFSYAPGVRHRIEDVPFDAGAGEVIYLPKIAEVKRAPAHTHTVTLIATRDGAERSLGTYTFRHRPWLGG